ncbi:MAG TPA: hypothetical protein VHD87_18045, partial [Acidimicrobiales bacterium]|nr:hypothetical protein [Acidimicrobiales bacterium]
MTSRLRVVVAGNGMVGHKFVETVLDRDGGAGVDVIVIGEETRVAYDRVGLSAYMTGTTAEELSLVTPGDYDPVNLHLAERVIAINRAAKSVATDCGNTIAYDA